jgi:enamine deaminase RidA (YjgF/YER057c/UK114 family)
MPNDLEAQTRKAMDGIQQTLAAAHATFADIVHMFVLRAHSRMETSAEPTIDEYFASYDHRPTATNLAVLELGEPEQLIEFQMFAVVD